MNVRIRCREECQMGWRPKSILQLRPINSSSAFTVSKRKTLFEIKNKNYLFESILNAGTLCHIQILFLTDSENLILFLFIYRCEFTHFAPDSGITFLLKGSTTGKYRRTESNHRPRFIRYKLGGLRGWPLEIF